MFCKNYIVLINAEDHIYGNCGYNIHYQKFNIDKNQYKQGGFIKFGTGLLIFLSMLIFIGVLTIIYFISNTLLKTEFHVKDGVLYKLKGVNRV